MWTFWKDKENFVYLLPLVAYYCDRQCLMFKFGWLKWRCGFYKERRENNGYNRQRIIKSSYLY